LDAAASLFRSQLEIDMANREQRSNREKKKKKAEKPKPPATQMSPFAHLQKTDSRVKSGVSNKRK
jgi:hypothetical protein